MKEKGKMSSCSSRTADHVCFPGSPFDCFDMNTPAGERMQFNQVEELYKTWWNALQFPFPLQVFGFPADWKRDLPLPVHNLALSFRDVNSFCITMWGPLTCLIALSFAGAWLFLIFSPQSDAVWYNVFLFATPIAGALLLEVMYYNVVAGHRSVLDFTKRFFPHVQGLGLFDYHLTRQHDTHLVFRQVFVLALSNLLIIANLVSTQGQRQALQTTVLLVFSVAIVIFCLTTVHDRMAGEFYASKVIVQIHAYFEQQGFSSKGPDYHYRNRVSSLQ